MKTNFDILQEEVGTWANTTFPKATWDSIMQHLKREVRELEYSTSVNDGEEIADCMILLMHAAFRRRVSAETAIRRKFAICQAREWGEPDEFGVIEHVRVEGDATP